MKKVAFIITCSAICVYVAAEVISKLPVKAHDIDKDSSCPFIPDDILKEVEDVQENS